MSIVTFNMLGRYGRLANQMYQIAGVIGVARRNGFDFAFPYWKNYDHLERFGSSEDIDIQKHFVSPLPLYDGPTLPDHPVPWGFRDVRLDRSVSLSGHFQSEKFFSHAIDEVKWYLRMKDEPALNHYVAIHVRRGDYDGSYHPRIPESYYREAMKGFPDCGFLVFSDDIPACKEMFGDEVEYSEGRDYLQDFKLMKRCQPSGTLVKTPDGEVRIESLEQGNRVTAYSGFENVHTSIRKLIGRGEVVRGRPPGRAIEDIGARPFVGNLSVVTTNSGRVSKYTPNHLSIVRFGDVFNSTQIVYLMRKSDQFRVGVTGPQSHQRGRKTERAKGFADIRTRLNSTQSDEAWVLTVFRDRDEALLEEKFISAAFGIPDVQFDGWRVNDAQSLRLARFWERFGSNLGGAQKCLSYYGRRLEFPFCRRHQRKVFVTDKESIIPACNIVSGMKLLDAQRYIEIADGVGQCDEAWSTVKVTKEHYEGLVYSMDVSINRSYVSDGLVTHNCRHFIVGNSSYSAMAAILGEHPDKAIVAPRPWFGPQYAQITGEDIYSDGWEVIDWQ